MFPFNWYYFVIDLLNVLFIYMMGRHLVARMLFFLHMFQQKGYKRGEYSSWILENASGYVFTPAQLWMNLIAIALVFFRDEVTPSAVSIVLFFLVLYWYGFDSRYRRTQAKKPLAFTARMKRLAAATAVLTLVPPVYGTALVFVRGEFLFDVYMLSLIWIVADALAPYWIYPASLLLQPVENSIQKGFIQQAKDKLARLSHVKVVAITGSYGKTSTKFVIRDLLRQRFNVCSTPGSYNTPMGITRVINDDLDASHEILILEMGARYPGNIDELCDIATPDIAVVTNVGVAHLETFGDVDTIRETKAALVRRLRLGGLAVLNADDENVMRMKSRADVTYMAAGLRTGDLWAEDIRYGADGCTFTACLADGTRETVQTRLLGSHNVLNLLQGLAVGLHLGLRLPTIALAMRDIEPVEHRLEMKKQGGVIVIDDAFNSNPVGAANAVEILSLFDTGRRVIVTPGMVELGELEEEANYDFGKAIGRANLDRIFLVGPQRTRPIKEGFLATGADPSKVEVVKNLFEANDRLRGWLQVGDVVLYENDLPDTYNE